MNLFHAALYCNGFKPGATTFEKLNDSEKQILLNVPHILDSYHYVHSQRYVDLIRANNGVIFLDSGAFSAHSLGASIDIDKYCDYIIENRDIIRVEDGDVMASVLDGIGDPKRTLENQLYMERKGAKPLPCFHFGEPDEYLHHYIKNYSYITLGGMVGKSVQDLIMWLDRIWNDILTDGAGNPLLKVHAFGITSERVMERYPWYSVDSSSWIQYSVYGHIFTSQWGVMPVSEKSPRRHDRGQHISNYSPLERQAIHQMLDVRGFNEERLSTVYESRAAFNCLAFCELNNTINNYIAKTNGAKDFMGVQQLF